MSRRVSIFGASFASNVYLFDDPTIAAGIAAPWATFRLKTAYTGPIVDVRRTVGATTAIVSVGLGSANYLTLDSPVTGVVTGSSTAINLGQFVNASGYANPDSLPAAQDWFYSKGYNQNNGAMSWEQPTAVSQPRGGTAGVLRVRNTVAEAGFDGTNDFMDFGLIGGATKPSNYSVLSVGAFDGSLTSEFLKSFCYSCNTAGLSITSWGGIANRGSNPGRLETGYGDGVAFYVGYTTAAGTIISGQRQYYEVYKQQGVARGTMYTDGTSRAITDFLGSATDAAGTNFKFTVGALGELLNFYHLLGGVQFIGVWTTHKESDRLAIKAKINAMLGTTW
jgi:hypothetical protein